MVNPIIALGLLAGAVVVVGSGALGGLGGFFGGIKDSLSGGGGAVSTESTSTIIDLGGGVTIPDNTGEFSTPAEGKANINSPVGDGSFLVPSQDPALVVAGITQKQQEALFRFRSDQAGQENLANTIDFFRKLQAQQLSQTSLGTSVILSEKDIARVISQQVSRTEQADIAALDLRRGDSEFKLSGADTVLLKRLEAERARIGVFDSSSVQNPNFNLGLPSSASKADIELAIRQQNENKIRLLRNEQIAIQRETNIKIGNVIIEATGASTLEQQKQIFTGLNISGGSALNAKTIGRLQELGFI